MPVVKLPCGKYGEEYPVLISNYQNEVDPRKRCVKCGQIKHLSEFPPYYHSTEWLYGNKFSKVFLLGKKCIKCDRISKPSKIVPEAKKCTKCTKNKPIEEFSILSSRKDKNGSSRISSRCKQCSREVRMTYYKNKPNRTHSFE